MIAPERVERFLQGLPVDALWGVGPVTAARLRAARHRAADRRPRPPHPDVLRSCRRKLADGLRRLSFGEDDRPVEPNRERKSVGREETFAKDLTDLRRSARSRSARAGCGRLPRRRRIYARTVTLKLRYSDFTTITRSATRTPPTRDAARSSAGGRAAREDGGRRAARAAPGRIDARTERDPADHRGPGAPEDLLPLA